MQKIMKTVAGVLCVLAIFAFAQCSKNKDDGTIKIGVFEPLTGANAAGGAQELEGVQLAYKLNPTVTVGGKEYKVDLIVADNKSDKVEAANAVQRLIDQGAKIILGSWGSGYSIAAGEVVKDAHIPAIGLTCTNPLVTAGNDWYFRICFIDPFQGTVMAKYAFDTLGAKTAVIVQEVSNDYSVGLAKYFVDTFTALTGNPASILATVNYNTGDQDFSAQLTQITSLSPDVVFAPGNFTESALAIKQARQLGITAPFIGGDTWETGIFTEVGGESVEGATFSSFYDSTVADSAIAQEFLDVYHQQFPGKEPSANAALGYDGYLFALDALQKAGTTDPQTVRDTIAKTSGFIGVTGETTLDANGDATKSAFIKQVKGGVFTFLTIVNP
ncbi:MAG: ABC transporter substrate-binding protein [Spirochaetaceae bacterium]|jgi:branched-chain amino acid transport system substrate-binding protein|nr:ABC transporter substrate-binding protein [Spirochaetaceae bacterium]